ncbi:MAG: toprim domain-containing protein [Oscillospiraceae bacterium]|nr:toprim domain-containing protein [Oscillospiraceae bacterium]
MKEHPSFEPIPDELVHQAASVDIAEYLMMQGVALIPAGPGRYRHPDHDSLVITGSMYYWNARKEHGNAIKFMRSYYDIGFREAVEQLLSSGAGKKIALPLEPPQPYNPAELEIAPNHDRVISYLTEQRGLSRLLVDQLIIDRYLFQEAKTNNAIFPIYENHRNVGAEVVGTMPQQRFKHIKTGSKYGCGYNLSFGEQTAFALFFESAIDLLSFVELSRMRGKDLAGCRLTSMMGLKPNIVEHTMQELEGAEPFLCVDNDEAGQSFIEAMGMKSRLPHPDFKDWNEQLQAMRQT